MNLDFDVENTEYTEFGVSRNEDDQPVGVRVAVDATVQTALGEMVVVTWEEMGNGDEEPIRYDPSEKHGSKEYLVIPMDDSTVTSLRALHNAANLPQGVDALRDPDAFSYYFARFVDRGDRRLTAVRRAAHFKGILKSRNRLVHWVDGSLKIVDDDVFKLDNDFDLIMDSVNVHILRPTAFEIIADMKAAILGAVPRNVESLREHLPFVNLSVVEDYVSEHPRAARYLASICSSGRAAGVDRERLMNLCERTKVHVERRNGLLSVTPENIMGFLEVLDRRRYGVDLVPQQPETYKAASRQKVTHGGTNA